MNITKRGFEKTLKFTNMALIMSGIRIHQMQRNNILEHFVDKYLYYINAVILHSVVFGEVCWVIDGIQIGRSFVELSLISPCITISVLGTMKTIFLYHNRDILTNIVVQLRDLHPELVENEDRNEIDLVLEQRNVIVNETKIFLKFVVLLLSSVCIVVIIMFCFTPMMVMGYEHYTMGESTVKYPFTVKYSVDVYNTYWWELIYFHQVWATTIVCLNILGSDTLLCAMCSYIGMHFRLLGLHFENIVSNNVDETKHKLIMAVKRHQELIDLVNRTEKLYSKSMLFNIITSSLLICLSAFNITVVEDFRTILAFITFLAMSLSQISLICLFGDMLMRSSKDVSGSIYNCSWYNADNNIKKIILIALIRAQKPCKLTAARFVDLNLVAFTAILSRSWSYFALLKTVYK